MRNKLALYGIVALLLALVASTAASARGSAAAALTTEKSARSATVSASQGSLTIHRLLQERLEWTRKLSRALRFLDRAPAAPGNGTHTIIDEPDPAGYGDAPKAEEGDNEELPPQDVNGDEDQAPYELGTG